MDYPFLVGFMVLAAVWSIGAAFERWSWAKPLAVAGTIALIAAGLWNALL